METVLTHYGGTGLYYYLTPDPNNQEQQIANTNIINNRLYYYNLGDNGIESCLKASNHIITDNTIGLNMKDKNDNLKELLLDAKKENIISGL
mgnify:CR=1 FL=1